MTDKVNHGKKLIEIHSFNDFKDKRMIDTTQLVEFYMKHFPGGSITNSMNVNLH